MGVDEVWRSIDVVSTALLRQVEFQIPDIRHGHWRSVFFQKFYPNPEAREVVET